MNQIALFTIALSFFIVCVYPQHHEIPANEKNETKGVVITYERTDKITDALQHKMIVGKSTTYKDQQDNKRVQGFVLKLHNHTKWAIKLQTYSLYVGNTVTPIILKNGNTVLGLLNELEVSVRYQVENSNCSESKLLNTQANSTDTYADSWLPPGQFITFGVNKEHLQNNSKIYVSYDYEWQTENKSQTPQNRAYFNTEKLPTENVFK